MPSSPTQSFSEAVKDSIRIGADAEECAIDRFLADGDAGLEGSRAAAAMHSMTCASRTLSSPSAPLEGNTWRQIGQMSLSCARDRDEGRGRVYCKDDSGSSERLNPGSASSIDLTRDLLLIPDLGLVTSMDE